MANDATLRVGIDSTGAALGARQFTTAAGSIRASAAGLASSVFSLRNAFLGLGAAYGIKEALAAGDAYQNLKARIEIFSAEGENATVTIQALSEAAERSRAPVSLLGEIFTRNSASLERMGQTTEDGIRLTETLAKTLAISGTSTAEAAGGLRQLSQAIASGVFRGEEFNSVAENIPEIMRILQRETGKTAGELRKLASEGKLTSEVLVNALSNAAADVDDKFSKMPETVESAWSRLTDVFSQGIGKAVEGTGATRAWADAIGEAAKFLQSDGGIAVFESLAGVVKSIGESFGDAARTARVMAEETRLAGEQAKQSEGQFVSLGSAIWSITKNAFGAIGEIGRRAVTGAGAQTREQAELNVDWQDATQVIRGDGTAASTPKKPIVFGKGEDAEAEKKLKRVREELSKNLEVERMRAAVTRAEIDGNTSLAQVLRTQLEVRSRISDDARKADPEKAAALAREIELQNALEIQLRSTQELQERNTAFARDFASTITDGLAGAIRSGESFMDTLKGIAARLVEVSVQAAVLKPLENSLTSALGGGLNSGGFDIGSLFSSATTSGWTPTVTMFAKGGVLPGPTRFNSGGMEGMAGEAGAEAILPLQRTASGALGVAAAGGAAGPVTFNVNIAGDASDATVEKMRRVAEMAVAQMSPGIVRQSVSSVRREIVRDRNFMRR